MRPFESGLGLESIAEAEATCAALRYTASQLVATSCADFASHYQWLEEETQDLINQFRRGGKNYDLLYVCYTDDLDVGLVLSALNVYLGSPKIEDHHAQTILTMQDSYIAAMLEP
ncbi:MAG TPA: hypothetical protein VFI74_05510 [Candidatus Saccharimonadales bacterium]|nr:hypothetical protein [Candidatus Saccharimonadales bacterium]